MKIETRFDKGDKVFVIFNGKVEQAKVRSISMYDGEVRYSLEFSFETISSNDYKESRLARTKEELVDRL